MIPLPGFDEGGQPHVVVERVQLDGSRRKVRRGFGGGRNFGDRKKHANDLSDDVDFVLSNVATRTPTLGIDPRLILVVETMTSGQSVAEEANWQRSGLRIVDTSTTKRVVAFSDDPAMSLFLARLEDYSTGPKKGQASAAHEAFFDNIDNVRPYGSQDRVGVELQTVLRQVGRDDDITVDVEVWYPGDVTTAESWLTLISDAIGGAGGVVHDAFSSEASGLALMRVSARASIVRQLLDVDLVAKVEVLPEALTINASPSEVGADTVSDLPLPNDSSPLVGIIDSGVVSNHPLLRGCIVAAVSTSAWIEDGADRHGHGTAVASILARGHLDGQISSNDWVAPPFRVVSVRVLDENAQIPPYRLAERELTDAAIYLAQQGVRVINLSLGDLNGMIVGNRAPSIAALLDALSRSLNVVFVVPTGNVAPREYAGQFDESLAVDYPLRMLESPNARLLDPAPAATALTVSSLVSPLGPLPLGTVSLGKAGWPSPVSRIGPGIGDAIKPELCAPAGTMGQEQESYALVEPDALQVAVADGRVNSTGVITHDFGSSLAAPHVSRVAALVASKYPENSANLIRALTLQSAEPVSSDFLSASTEYAEGAPSAEGRRFVGYGEASSLRSAESAIRDTVLIAESNIPVDGVHLYAVPVPEAFFTRKRASRGMTVTLSFDPLVRARRMDYLSTRLKFEVVRGLPADEVIELFLSEADDAAAGTRVKIPNRRGLKVSGIPTQKRITMEPAQTVRSLGANQLARKTWQNSLPRFNDFPNDFFVVVQSLNRWAPPTSMQPYALTVRLWVDEKLPPIYEEVRTKVSSARIRARGRAQAR
ncbi:S8 family peptidase [Streptomyces sp. NPDC003717]|uniref:S8 family peptidase n=1 Tax=Streptomyces sp. NPDC003717 TaxID=3154276 RepID=UPI0033A8B9F0